MKKTTFILVLLSCVPVWAQVAGTSFEEPDIFPGLYTDTGDPLIAHPLENNPGEPLVNFPATGAELGYTARYEPYDTPGDGLSDGDEVGITDLPPNGSQPYPSGLQGYRMSDIDGNYILTFDTVDLIGTTNPSLSIEFFIAETGYEGDGTANASGSDRLRIYVRNLTDATEIDILNTTGNDINDLSLEGVWITGIVVLEPDTTIQLVIEARNNSGAESFYFDHIEVNATLGITEVDHKKFSIAPNPASSDYIAIRSPLPGPKDIWLFNVVGEEVLQAHITEDRLDISNLNSGVYFLRIEQGPVNKTLKLVIQ